MPQHGQSTHRRSSRTGRRGPGTSPANHKPPRRLGPSRRYTVHICYMNKACHNHWVIRAILSAHSPHLLRGPLPRRGRTCTTRSPCAPCLGATTHPRRTAGAQRHQRDDATAVCCYLACRLFISLVGRSALTLLQVVRPGQQSSLNGAVSEHEEALAVLPHAAGPMKGRCLRTQEKAAFPLRCCRYLSKSNAADTTQPRGG